MGIFDGLSKMWKDAGAANALEKAIEAAKAGELAQAFGLYLVAAQRGSAEAKFNLGCVYLEGKGIPSDPSRAAWYFREAAEQGVAQAQFNLALLLDQGNGVRRDPEEAAKWLRLAAEQGLGSVPIKLEVGSEA